MRRPVIILVLIVFSLVLIGCNSETKVAKQEEQKQTITEVDKQKAISLKKEGIEYYNKKDFTQSYSCLTQANVLGYEDEEMYDYLSKNAYKLNIDKNIQMNYLDKRLQLNTIFMEPSLHHDDFLLILTCIGSTWDDLIFSDELINKMKSKNLLMLVENVLDYKICQQSPEKQLPSAISKSVNLFLSQEENKFNSIGQIIDAGFVVSTQEKGYIIEFPFSLDYKAYNKMTSLQKETYWSEVDGKAVCLQGKVVDVTENSVFIKIQEGMFTEVMIKIVEPSKSHLIDLNVGDEIKACGWLRSKQGTIFPWALENGQFKKIT